MKIVSSISIQILLLSSCMHRTTDQPVLNTTENKTEVQSNTIGPDEIKINASYPFGYFGLTKYEVSKFWKADSENYGQLKKPEGEEFDQIGEYFRKLNAVPNIGTKSETINIEQINLDSIDSYFDTLALKLTDSIKYRLPDVGKYECYYSFQNASGKYGEYGNLLFWKKTNRTGKLINVYYEIGGDQSTHYRYFSFDGSTLKIYNGACYDDGCSLKETYNLKINKDGEISLLKISK